MLTQSLVQLSTSCLSISVCFCLHVDENMPINLKVAIPEFNDLLSARAGPGLICKETGPGGRWASGKNRRLSPGGHTQGTVPRGVRWVCLLSPLFACDRKVGCSLGGCRRRTRDSMSHLSNCSIRSFHI